MSISISKNSSEKIRAVSLICAFLVVLLHAYDQHLTVEDNPLAWYAGKFLSGGLASIAVPFFFIVSGFLLTKQHDGGMAYGDLLKRRLRSLGVPYVIWCLLYAMTYMLFTIWGNKLAGRPLNFNTCLALPLSSWQNPFRIFGFDLNGFPAAGHLWYIRNLLLLVIVSPLLLSLMKSKTTGWCAVAVAAVPYFCHFIIPERFWQFFESGFSFRGLLFFMIGIQLARFPLNWRPNLFVALSVCLVWFVSAWPWGLAKTTAFVVFHLSFIVGCVAMWSIYDFLLGHEKLGSWHGAHYSFFIYASHYAILNMLFCQKACSLIQRHIVDSDLLIYVIRFVVPVVLAIALAYFLERYMPKIYRVLTGGR